MKMKKEKIYKIHDGIIHGVICGRHLLIPARPAWKYCTTGTVINETGAFFWNLLEKNGSLEWMAGQAAQYYHTDIERIYPGLEKFCQQLQQDGYIYEDIVGDGVI